MQENWQMLIENSETSRIYQIERSNQSVVLAKHEFQNRDESILQKFLVSQDSDAGTEVVVLNPILFDFTNFIIATLVEDISL